MYCGIHGVILYFNQYNLLVCNASRHVEEALKNCSIALHATVGGIAFNKFTSNRFTLISSLAQLAKRRVFAPSSLDVPGYRESEICNNVSSMYNTCILCIRIVMNVRLSQIYLYSSSSGGNSSDTYCSQVEQLFAISSSLYDNLQIEITVIVSLQR